jgi:aryl-alcohol dehydrogenase-like predicted oxidoreductase
MKTRLLGRSNISVSRLCFGSLTVSPSQADLSPLAGGELIAYALNRGVNFIDTAQMINYPHIKAALNSVSRDLYQQ